MPTELLFIRAEKEQIPDTHLDAFKRMCEANGVKFTYKDIQTVEDFKDSLKGNYKYICLAGHGNKNGFGDEKSLDIPWDEIGEMLCESGCFTFNAKLLLYCCEGGLAEAGCALIEKCPRLDFIIGTKSKQNSIDFLNAFNIFIYNIQILMTDDVTAAHKSMQATNCDFEHFHLNATNQTTGDNYCEACEEMRES